MPARQATGRGRSLGKVGAHGRLWVHVEPLGNGAGPTRGPRASLGNAGHPREVHSYRAPGQPPSPRARHRRRPPARWTHPLMQQYLQEMGQGQRSLTGRDGRRSRAWGRRGRGGRQTQEPGQSRAGLASVALPWSVDIAPRTLSGATSGGSRSAGL